MIASKADALAELRRTVAENEQLGNEIFQLHADISGYRDYIKVLEAELRSLHDDPSRAKAIRAYEMVMMWKRENVPGLKI